MANSHYDVRGLKQTDKKDDLAPCVKFVVENWDSWNNHFGNRFAEFETYYDAWIGKPPQRDESWQAQFHKKLTWQAEKTLVARYHTALFPSSSPIETDSTEVEDELTAIKSKSIVAHWFKIGMVSKEFLSCMRSAAIYGTGLLEDDWYLRTEDFTERIEKNIPDFRPMALDNGETLMDEEGRARVTQVGTKRANVVESKRKVVEDRYRVQKANIFAWRIHPNKLTDDDDFPVIKQEFVTYDDLKEREIEAKKLGFKGFENMKEISEDSFGTKEDKDKEKLFKDGTFVDKKNPMIELLHYWGLYKDEDDKKAEKKPMWITIVNRKYKLRLMDNPRWDKKSPLFHIVWTEDEKPSYYGIGLAQIGKEMEDRVNNIINIRTDIKKKIARGGGWYNAMDKKIKKKHIQSNVPGLWRPSSDPSKAGIPDPPIPLTPDDYREEEIAMNDHREITGATPTLNPASDKKQQHETLGGMQLLLSQSIQKLRPDLAMMEMMGIRKIANRAFLLTRQYLTKELMIELMASKSDLDRLQVEKIYKLSPREIIGKVNFYCTGLGESIEKGQNIERLMKFAEITAKVPGMQQVTNYQGIIKKIALYLGFEDVEELIQINPEEPLKPIEPLTPPNQLAQQAVGGQGGQQRPQGPQGGGNGGGQQIPPQILARIAQSLGGRQGQPQGGGRPIPQLPPALGPQR